MASGGSGRDGPGDDKKPPKDIKELLQMCVQTQGQVSQTEEEAPPPPMTQERREWLENALLDLTVSPVQRMKAGIQILQSSECKTEQKVKALEEIAEWCENIDIAADFHKIGGFGVIKDLLKNTKEEIRWNTLELIATLVQNHTYCQEAALKENLLKQMLDILDRDEDPTVKTKALYAISCLTRDVPAAQKVFTDCDGFSVLMRAMQTDVEKLKVKAAFMLTALCNNKPEFKDIMCDIGMIDQLVGHLNEGHSMFHEHIMSALLSIVTDHERALQESQRTELGLQQTLQQRIKFLEGKEEYREEKAYATELLNLISKDSVNELQSDDMHDEVMR